MKFASADCPRIALGWYVNDDEDIPSPNPIVDGQTLIEIPFAMAAKLALYTAMREQGITEADDLISRLEVPCVK
ncbi:MAG: hypothetical protein F4Y44_10085 [Chloroflexi bacterium]|nr:hypothetical protein [Chloroflexota bacterium]